MGNRYDYLPEGDHSWHAQFTTPAKVSCSRCGRVEQAGGDHGSCPAMRCRTCALWFNPEDLEQVVFHEHAGISTEGLGQVPPGERIA